MVLGRSQGYDHAERTATTLTLLNDCRPNEPWEGWPLHCRNFKAAIDNADEICSHFCTDISCRDCTPEEAFHLSTFTRAGGSLYDGKVDTVGLQTHLDDVGELGDRETDENAAHYRLYFVAANAIEGCMKTPYMRRLLWHYQTPSDVALGLIPNSVGLGFQAYTEIIDRGANTPPTRILHCWLNCLAQLTKDDQKANLDLFSEQRRKLQIERSENFLTVNHDPTFYMAYDYQSGHCALMCTEHSTIFRALQQTCRDAVQMKVDQDPFVFFVVFLTGYLGSVRRTAVELRKHIYGLSDVLTHPRQTKEDRYVLLRKVTQDRLAYGRIADGMQGVVQVIDALSKEHLDLCEARVVSGFGTIPDDVIRWVENSLERQKAVASQLELILRDCAETTQSFTETLLGFSQLRNSYATEALAVDAKRDTQTMKTITYVTLLFLPSTFVATIFSMGVFDFDSDMHGDGHITVSRHGWIVIAVALPLTAITIALAYLWMRLSGTTSREQESELGAGFHFRVWSQKREGGPKKDIPLRDLCKECMIGMLASLNEPAGSHSPANTHGGGSRATGVRFVRRPCGPDGQEYGEEEEISRERVPPECIIPLKAQLEQLLAMKELPWYTRIAPWIKVPAILKRSSPRPDPEECQTPGDEKETDNASTRQGTIPIRSLLPDRLSFGKRQYASSCTTAV